MDVQKVKRRIIDYLHKYATEEQIKQVAELLKIKTDS